MSLYSSSQGSSVEEEIARRSLVYMIDNMRKHSVAEIQGELLDQKLMATVLRLKQAHVQERGSYQYLLGLKCLIFWELKQLYAYYSAGCVVRVQRNSLRHRYFSDPESRLLFPMGIRLQMWEEYQGMAENGTDPEDHYADMVEDDEDDTVEEATLDESQSSYQHQPRTDNNTEVGYMIPEGDDMDAEQGMVAAAATSSNYEEERIVFPERLHCFLAWDLFNRAN